MKNKIGKFSTDTVKGVTLGVSVAIPGLSAGTIAVSERCYDTIIDSISDFKKEPKRNFLILLPFLLGIIIGAVCAFIGIKKGYTVAPFTLTGLFAGLVIGSLPIAIKELKKGNSFKEKIIHVVAFLLSLAVAAGIGIGTALGKFSLAEYMSYKIWWMYILMLIAGFLAAFTMVVPGISGSMTMMILGLYHPFLGLFIGDDSMFNTTGDKKIVAITAIVFTLLLLVGAFCGLIVSSKVMKKLLSKYRVTTFYAILGLIIGSTVSMFINSDIYPKYTSNAIENWDYIVGSILLVVGVLLSLGLVYLDNHRTKMNLKQNGFEDR